MYWTLKGGYNACELIDLDSEPYSIISRDLFRVDAIYLIQFVLHPEKYLNLISTLIYYIYAIFRIYIYFFVYC